MRRHHLSSSRPTSASLPCNLDILLRRMPFARPVPVTPPFSPLPGDYHPTPPAPSAKPPIPRFYDLLHRLQRRARLWMLASSISLPDSERRLTLPLTRSISDQVGSSVAALIFQATPQLRFLRLTTFGAPFLRTTTTSPLQEVTPTTSSISTPSLPAIQRAQLY
jgi:hypothetical protein